MQPKIGAVRHSACGCLRQYAFWDRSNPNTACWSVRIPCKGHETPEYRAQLAEDLYQEQLAIEQENRS